MSARKRMNGYRLQPDSRRRRGDRRMIAARRKIDMMRHFTKALSNEVKAGNDRWDRTSDSGDLTTPEQRSANYTVKKRHTRKHLAVDETGWWS